MIRAPRKDNIKLPPDVKLENAPEGRPSRSSWIAAISTLSSRRACRSCRQNNPNIGWLFRDPIAAGKDYYKRTGIFPIMHVIGIRRTLVEQHPWLPAAVIKAFEQSKAKCLESWKTPRPPNAPCRSSTSNSRPRAN